MSVVIPALDEERGLAAVLAEIPRWVDQVIVADNGSSDATAVVARRAGAEVVDVGRSGYGRACMAGIASARSDIVVFLDADCSDVPGQMVRLVSPIAANLCDLVIGSRRLGHCQPGALTRSQRYGNGLAVWLIRRGWGHGYTDLGPFRAIRRDCLPALNMSEMTFGWTVEMQIKAIETDLRICEVPVDYRQRIGVSKISGTWRGVFRAGSGILGVIARRWLRKVIGRIITRA